MDRKLITSRQNPLIQHVKKLQSSRSYRQESGQFVADGLKLLQEAIDWYPGLHTVISDETVTTPELPAHVQQIAVPHHLMQWLSRMQAPQGIVFVCNLPKQAALKIESGCLILDGIQDPGNLGTILRTADALNVPLVLSDGCADPYNEKTVRASMGAVFRTQPQCAEKEEILKQCRERKFPLAVTALTEQAKDIRQAELSRYAVVIGSEGQGICAEYLQAAAEELIIPMNEHCESLNAAVAAAIVMWQMKR